MIGKHIFRATFLSLALQGFMTSQEALADPPSVAPLVPLTQLEQAGRVSGLASQTFGRGLFVPSIVVSAPYYQRNYSSPWLSASSYERKLLGERIGNQGRARFAAEQGWIKVIGSQNRGIVQGPDSAVWDPRRGYIRVLEAKGGSSPLKWTYESWQGTNQNAIRSAEFVLRSTVASPLEKLAAARVVKAAQKNRLQTGVVRTSHEKGVAEVPRLDGGFDRESVAKEAGDIERRLTQQNPTLASIFRKAGTAQLSDMLKYRAGQGLTILGLAGSGMLGWDAYQQSQDAWEMWSDAALQNTALPYLQTGLAGGRWLESASLGLGSATQLGLLGKGGLRIFGHAAGKWFLPIAIGVEGLSAGTACYEYSTGRISKREFYRRTTGPAVFGVFTTGGAVIGGIAGSSAAGVGALPGAGAGAGIGALVAVPVQFTADWTWNWYYRKFDEKQRAAVDEAVERRYALPSQ
jgi:hypothetical protein